MKYGTLQINKTSRKNQAHKKEQRLTLFCQMFLVHLESIDNTRMADHI